VDKPQGYRKKQEMKRAELRSFAGRCFIAREPVKTVDD
jgi:hypothetical protein